MDNSSHSSGDSCFLSSIYSALGTMANCLTWVILVNTHLYKAVFLLSPFLDEKTESLRGQ